MGSYSVSGVYVSGDVLPGAGNTNGITSDLRHKYEYLWANNHKKLQIYLIWCCVLVIIVSEARHHDVAPSRTQRQRFRLHLWLKIGFILRFMIVPSRSKESSLRYAFYTDGPWVSGQSPCLQRPPKANIAFWALFDMVMLEVRQDCLSHIRLISDFKINYPKRGTWQRELL